MPYIVTASETQRSTITRGIRPGWFDIQDAICELLDVDEQELAALVLHTDEYDPAICPGALTNGAVAAGLVTIREAGCSLPCERRWRRWPGGAC
jgi:hypothetical protein